MSVGSAKAKLDAQGGDPPTGYISKQDVKDSYDELVDDTALTGATTAEAVTVSGALVAGTVNGRDPDDLVKGPASATDNALTRFDGTDGKTVQNSGITVDDSGNVSSNLTVSKASAILNVSATSGYPELKLTRNAGNYGLIGFYTGSSPRFQVGVTEIAESGSSAGSNFAIYRQNDAGTTASTPFEITRSSGKVRLGDVGASAGLELGTSGPRVMSGTGSPEGVVTAPVGSKWIRTDGDTLGDFEYQKRAGTGNTGWVVSEGDTGWRNVASLITANATDTISHIYLRRLGPHVYLSARIANSSMNTAHELFAANTGIPSGFRPYINYALASAVAEDGSGYANGSFSVRTNGLTYYRVATASYVNISTSWPTSETWPSSLPGSAA